MNAYPYVTGTMSITDENPVTGDTTLELLVQLKEYFDSDPQGVTDWAATYLDHIYANFNLLTRESQEVLQYFLKDMPLRKHFGSTHMASLEDRFFKKVKDQKAMRPQAEVEEFLKLYTARNEEGGTPSTRKLREFVDNHLDVKYWDIFHEALMEADYHGVQRALEWVLGDEESLVLPRDL